MLTKSFKQFWSSRAVKKTVLIFLGIVIIMALAALLSVLATGCNQSQHYKQVSKPTLVLDTVGQHWVGKTKWTRLFFVVANPTENALNTTVKCCLKTDPTSCVEKEVVARSHRDTAVDFTVINSVSCYLDN